MICEISAGADGGPRSRVGTHLNLYSVPHRHQRKFLAAHVWWGGVNIFESFSDQLYRSPEHIEYQNVHI